MRSAASSQRAAATASAGVTEARIRSAPGALRRLETPPGISPQHRVQPAGRLGAQAPGIAVPLGPDLQHRRMVVGPHLRAGCAQGRDRDRAGVVGVVLVHVPGRRQPHPRAEFRLHAGHSLAGRDQLPGEQVAHAAGALDRPGPLRPGLCPVQELPGLPVAGADPHLAQGHLITAGRHRRMRSLVRVHPDDHCRHRHAPPSLHARLV